MLRRGEDIVMHTITKKMSWFDKWFLKQSKKAWEHRFEETASQPSVYPTMQIDQPNRAVRFTVYHASGGRVVETSRYDHKNDRPITGLYIIGNNQDFGKEIDKILTVESLKS